MIREMRASDWGDMMEIYKQSLEKGDVTFRTECPTYEEWDEGTSYHYAGHFDIALELARYVV